jgi:hypothetical protein
MDPLRYAYFAASFNLAMWTIPMAIDMVGKNFCYGIWWTGAISWFIFRTFFPKPLPEVIDIEFKETGGDIEWD